MNISSSTFKVVFIVVGHMLLLPSQGCPRELEESGIHIIDWLDWQLHSEMQENQSNNNFISTAFVWIIKELLCETKNW